MIDIIKEFSAYDINSEQVAIYASYIQHIHTLGQRNIDVIEHHHIVPKSVNPLLKTSRENIICLTPSEHFHAHRILCKCFNGINKRNMIYAFKLMCGLCKSRNMLVTEEDYEIIRSNKELFQLTEEEKRKISRANKGNKSKTGQKDSEYTRSLKSYKNKLRKRSQESIDKTTKGLKKYYETHNAHNKGVPISEHRRIQISNTLKNRYKNDSSLKKRIWLNRKHLYGNDNPSFGRKAMHKGNKQIFVKEEDIECMLSKGWKLGKVRMKYMNKDGKNTTVPLSMVQEYLDKGYTLGRI